MIPVVTGPGEVPFSAVPSGGVDVHMWLAQLSGAVDGLAGRVKTLETLLQDEMVTGDLDRLIGVIEDPHVTSEELARVASTFRLPLRDMLHMPIKHGMHLGLMPLTLAMLSDNEAVLSFVFAQEPTPFVINGEAHRTYGGMSPFEMAITGSNARAVKGIFSIRGVNPLVFIQSPISSGPAKGSYPIQCAVANIDTLILDQIIEIDPDAINCPSVPLADGAIGNLAHMAVESRSAVMLNHLREEANGGQNLFFLTDTAGRTPLALAKEKGVGEEILKVCTLPGLE